MISHLAYPLSRYRFTLEQNRFVALMGEPDSTRLSQLASIVSHFLKQNPLVKVTAVGLNFGGFMSYSEMACEDGEAEFLRAFGVPVTFEEIVGSDIRAGTLLVVYETRGVRCGLGLRSDATLKDNRGVAIDLNIHKDVSKRREAYSQIAQLEDWLRYFLDLGERISGYVRG
jgi:hypothetical protein